MKNGLLYRKHEETKTGRSSNQLVIPKGLRQQVMSVNHESEFSGHLGAKTGLHQDSAVPVMCAKEQLRRVMSRKYHCGLCH